MPKILVVFAAIGIVTVFLLGITACMELYSILEEKWGNYKEKKDKVQGTLHWNFICSTLLYSKKNDYLPEYGHYIELIQLLQNKYAKEKGYAIWDDIPKFQKQGKKSNKNAS